MFYQFLYPLSEKFQLFNVFKYITFRSLAALLTATLIYFLFSRRWINFLVRKKMGQVIRQEGPESHQSKQGTPTMGGVLILFSALVSTVLWGNFQEGYTWLCLGVFVAYGAIGLIDDYSKFTQKHNRGLAGRYKMLLQIGLALATGLILIQWLGMKTELNFPFYRKFQPDLGYLYLGLIALVMVGASNAVNLTDGLDGLVSVPCITSYATYGLFAYIAGNAKIAEYLYVPAVPGAGEVAVFCTAIIGALLAFLWYNSHPAEIFMGDVGSLSLGASLGLVSIITKNEILLIIVGGIFVIEALSVITQVTSFQLTGKRIFKMTPLHHHFELKGWAEPKVIVRFWILSFLLCLVSLATLKLR